MRASCTFRRLARQKRSESALGKNLLVRSFVRALRATPAFPPMPYEYPLHQTSRHAGHPENGRIRPPYLSLNTRPLLPTIRSDSEAPAAVTFRPCASSWPMLDDTGCNRRSSTHSGSDASSRVAARLLARQPDRFERLEQLLRCILPRPTRTQIAPPAGARDTSRRGSPPCGANQKVPPPHR